MISNQTFRGIFYGSFTVLDIAGSYMADGDGGAGSRAARFVHSRNGTGGAARADASLRQGLAEDGKGTGSDKSRKDRVAGFRVLEARELLVRFADFR